MNKIKIISFLLVIIFILSSCSGENKSQNNNIMPQEKKHSIKSNDLNKQLISPSWNEIKLSEFIGNIPVSNIEDIYVTFSDKNNILISVGLKQDNPKTQSLDLIQNRYLVKYNISSKESAILVTLEDKRTILDAVIKDNCVYYVVSTPNYQSDLYELYSLDLNEKKTILIGNFNCMYYNLSPNIEIIDNSVMVVYQDISKNIIFIDKINYDNTFTNIYQIELEKNTYFDSLSFECNNNTDFVLFQTNEEESCFNIYLNSGEIIKITSKDYVQSYAIDISGLYISYVSSINDSSYLKYVPLNNLDSEYVQQFPNAIYRLTSSYYSVLGVADDGRVVSLQKSDDEKTVNINYVVIPQFGLECLPSFKKIDDDIYIISFLFSEKGEDTYKIYIADFH